MEVCNNKGLMPHRDRRVARARQIPADDIELFHVMGIPDPDGVLLVVGEFRCRSQSDPTAWYTGRFGFNGGIVEEDCECLCPDWANGFLCKHVIGALLSAGCPEEYLA